jgi:hypothetical protein
VVLSLVLERAVGDKLYVNSGDDLPKAAIKSMTWTLALPRRRIPPGYMI